MRITRYRITYHDKETGEKGNTYFSGGKKSMSKQLRELRSKNTSTKWNLQKYQTNAWVKRK